jgi:hypothetical protein
MPLDEGRQAIGEFIEGGKVNTITHVLGTDNLWGGYGALGTPSWMTINNRGETRVGVGALTADVINGTWVS